MVDHIIESSACECCSVNFDADDLTLLASEGSISQLGEMHLPSGAGVESSTLPDIPNSIYNGNGFNINGDAVNNQGIGEICTPRQKIVIVGLGMVALSFMYVVPGVLCTFANTDSEQRENH